jgi:hypothetical protein
MVVKRINHRMEDSHKKEIMVLYPVQSYRQDKSDGQEQFLWGWVISYYSAYLLTALLRSMLSFNENPFI